MSTQLTNGLADNKHALRLEDKIRDLRALQHFVLEHPDLEVSWFGDGTIYLATPHPVDEDGFEDFNAIDVTKVAAQVRLMKDGGTVEKQSTDDYMTYTRRIGHRGKIVLTVPRKAVCTAKVVGQEKVVIQPKPAEPGRTEVRDIIEWECAPILEKASE